MYKIIGADGQQYGPVNLEQIAGGWLKTASVPDTLAQAEGATHWKPRSSLSRTGAGKLKTPPPTITPLAPPPASNPRASDKVAAGVCGILLGGFGVHKFILGYTGAGVIMLLISLLSCGSLYFVMHIIGLVEGIVYLTKSDDTSQGGRIREPGFRVPIERRRKRGLWNSPTIFRRGGAQQPPAYSGLSRTRNGPAPAAMLGMGVRTCRTAASPWGLAKPREKSGARSAKVNSAAWRTGTLSPSRLRTKDATRRGSSARAGSR